MDFRLEGTRKNRESFDLNAAKFESGAMRFWGKKIAPALEPFQNKDSPLSFYQGTVNGELKFIQNRSKNRF